MVEQSSQARATLGEVRYNGDGYDFRRFAPMPLFHNREFSRL